MRSQIQPDRRLRRVTPLLLLTAALCLAHALAGPRMIDGGVAPALLSGHGGLTPILLALAFLLTRLLAALMLACLPAALLRALWRR